MDNQVKGKNSDDQTSWGQALLSLGLTVTFWAVALFTITYLINSLLGTKIDTYSQIYRNTYNVSNYSFGDYPSLSTFVFWLLSIIFYLFLVYRFSHFLARKFAGYGTLRGLIVRANPWTILNYSFIALGSAISNYLLVNIVVAQESLEVFDLYYAITNMLILVVWVIWSLGISRILSKYYYIEQSKGCLSIILMHLSTVSLTIILWIMVINPFFLFTADGQVIFFP